MGVLAKPLETPLLASRVAFAAAMIRDWRSEVAKQWSVSALKLEQPELVALLGTWQARGLDPETVLWAVLGAEWLFRARRATDEDVRAELNKIRDALLRGSPDPNHAVLVVEVAGRSISRALKKGRYLLSYGTFTLPSASLVMRYARGSRPITESDPVQTLPVVRMRRGPIPKLGPYIASVLVQGMADRRALHGDSSVQPGLALASLLLKRRVLEHEFLAWKATLDLPISDPAPGLSEPEHRKTLGDWLLFRFERMHGSMSAGIGWNNFCHEARHNPAFIFGCVGDLQTARDLYGLQWG